MRKLSRLLLLVLLLIGAGCSKRKSTEELISDLKSNDEKSRLIAVRLLPERKEDAAKVVPALIAALKDKEGDVRCSAAIGLGHFGEQAKEAIPALQIAQRDHDARVREAVGVALARIDPAHFQSPKGRRGRGK
jgi:HEAT repeat protein